jgi:CubicO group peptidase (beta-lactamase class C family)
MIAYLQGGGFNGAEFLSSASINEMLSFQIPEIDNVQGLNWYTEEIYLSGGGVIDLWGHNGGESGATTDLYIDPDNGIGMAVLSNAEGENLYVVDELYDYALSLSTSGVGNPACGPVSVGDGLPSRPILNAHPNPATNEVTIESANGGFAILYSVLGKEVFRKEVQPVEMVDVSELGSGQYILALRNERIKLVIR